MSIQPFTPHELAVAGPGDMPVAVRNIIAWAGVLNAASSMVEQLIDTPFVPAAFWPLPNGVQLKDFPNPQRKHPRESPEEFALRRVGACAAASGAIMYGGNLGFDPLVSLMSVHVVRGRPGLYAEAMDALLKSHGHQIEEEELTDARCVMRGRRKGETDWKRYTFTIQRAQTAGYVAQNAKYKTDPQSMLKARALSLACRGTAADVLKGIASVEEIVDEFGVDVEVQPARTRTVKRAEPRQVAAGPAAEAEASAAADQDPRGAQTRRPAPPSGPPLPGEETGPAPLDQRQWDAINREFVRLEVVGDGQKAARLTVISAVVGRPISRGGELTADEGQLVLDNLAGNNGFEVVAKALNLPRTPAGGEPQQDDIGDADPDTDVDDAEPTDEEWDAMSGAEAEAEASRG